ncbi:MAG: acetylornithine deacetylase [Gammaproteobacteria bacterium]
MSAFPQTISDWLKKLISFDTTSRNSNLNLIDTIDDWLKTQGMTSRRTYDASQQKANLFATLPASNGSVQQGIILSGHTDVVPVDGQEWNTDPFIATEIDDRVYGRGTADMKGFIAVVLALIPEFKKQQLSQPIHFAFSYDEEVGCHGVRDILTDIKQQGLQPRACVVGEPTLMRPVVAHKGINVFRVRVHGRASHSSLTTKGCNAIEYAAQLMNWIREFGKTLQHGPQDKFYDVPFSSMTTNLISGGNAINTIPNLCEFFFEFRNLPTVSPQTIRNQIESYIKNELLPNMQQEYQDAGIELDLIAAVPGLEASEQATITKIIRALTNEHEIFKVAYATEAGLFQQDDIPTIVCGPGSIEQAHRADEYIMLEQLKQCEKFLLELVQNKI